MTARVRRTSASSGAISLHQRLRILALRDQRAHELQSVGHVEHQQHALGAAELGGLVDQEFVQLGAAAQLVQAQAGVDQALEGFAQAGLALEMRTAAGGRELALARIVEPARR